MPENINERVAKLEEKVESHERSIIAQADKNESLAKLTTLMELQSKANEKQNAQLEKFGETLIQVNLNLTNINNSQQQLQKEVIQIGNRVEVIEQKSDENKLDPSKVIWKIVGWVVGAIGAIILAYVLFKLGLK